MAAVAPARVVLADVPALARPSVLRIFDDFGTKRHQRLNVGAQFCSGGRKIIPEESLR
jgi:hypothetical protein